MPKATPKPKKKIKRSTLENKADALFSKIIRSPGACRRCGSTTGLQCAHLVSRGYHAVRWDFDNAVCLCSGCHKYFTHHPIEWENYIEKILGPYHLQKVKEKALTTQHPSYEEIIEELTPLLKLENMPFLI